MVYKTYICDSCGYSTEEPQGVYLCPKCHNQMRIAQEQGVFGGGDTTVTDSKILGYILLFFILLPILFGLLNVFGIIIFIPIFYYYRKSQNKTIRNNAIPVKKQVETHGKFCPECGHELNSDDHFCRNCGFKL